MGRQTFCLRGLEKLLFLVAVLEFFFYNVSVNINDLCGLFLFIMAKAVIVVGQPCSGKSTLLPLAAQILSKSGNFFISLDNEDFGVRPETRISMTTALGLSNPDDPEFRRTVGLRILLDTMDSIANHLLGIAMSIPAVVGLIHMPDKDPKSLIAGVPVFEKTIEDYSARGIQIIGVVALTFEVGDEFFVSTFRARLERGAEGSAQRLLDAPKLAQTDLLFRRRCCEQTAALYKEAQLLLTASPQENAEVLAKAIASIL